MYNDFMGQMVKKEIKVCSLPITLDILLKTSFYYLNKMEQEERKDKQREIEYQKTIRMLNLTNRFNK